MEEPEEKGVCEDGIELVVRREVIESVEVDGDEEDDDGEVSGVVSFHGGEGVECVGER